MNTRHFLSQLDEERIVKAIARSERRTSGEIRVFVSRRKTRQPLEDAKARFLKLGMHRTSERNAVLIYLAPRAQSFAIVGDTAVHARCGDAFWQSLTAAMSESLKREHFTEALVQAVEKCGELLAEHFPRSRHDEGPNQLPDDIGKD